MLDSERPLRGGRCGCVARGGIPAGPRRTWFWRRDAEAAEGAENNGNCWCPTGIADALLPIWLISVVIDVRAQRRLHPSPRSPRPPRLRVTNKLHPELQITRRGV